MADRLQDHINAIMQWMDHHNDDQPADALPGEEAESKESKAEPADEQVVESSLATSVDDPLRLAAVEDEPPGARTLHNPAAIEHTPLLDAQAHAALARWAAGVGVLLLLAMIAYQVLHTFLTPAPTITLVPVVRDLSTTATMLAVSGTPTRAQIPARLLPPLTLIQTTTAMATGKGHQDAEAAMGTITFYNGLFTSQTIAASTTLTGSDGVQVVTDQLAVIPAASRNTLPPRWCGTGERPTRQDHREKKGGRQSYRAHRGYGTVPVQPAGTPTDQATRCGQNTITGSTHPVGPARNTARNYRRFRRK